MSGTWRITEGDCVEILPRVSAHSAAVCLADPPYIIGGTSIGNPNAKAGTWADMMNAAAWYRDWFNLCARALRPNGYLLVFGNWRSLPTYLRACTLADHLFPSSCMVWDKQWIGPASPRALRPRWELILWLSMPEAQVEDRSAADIVSCKWMAGNMAESDHPAEKPRSLIRELLSLAAPRGGLVVDPFAGTGAAGLAALDLGMDYFGIEADPAHATDARAALTAHARQGSIDFHRGYDHQAGGWTLEVHPEGEPAAAEE